MDTIRFSERYVKLHEQVRATLLAVYVVNSADLVDGFKTYNTMHVSFSRKAKFVTAYNIIPVGKCILLIFIGNYFIPFTTVRCFTPEKNDAWFRSIGKTYDIEIFNKDDT